MLVVQRKASSFGLILLCIFITSCYSKFSSSDFIDYVEQQESFRKTSVNQGIVLRCHYYPAAYMALLDYRSVPENQIRQSDFAKSLNEYTQSLYFMLSFESEDGRDITTKNVYNQQMYQQRLYDMSYYFDRHICLVTDKQDTLRPSIFTYQKTFTNSSKASFLLGFAQSPALLKAKQIELIYLDAYFNLYKSVHFTFSNTEINQKLPTITFTNL